jgi:hypothetical protein
MAIISELYRNTSTIIFRIGGLGVEDLDVGRCVL